jgi:uncharacterized protein YbaR (Trm112 family)
VGDVTGKVPENEREQMLDPQLLEILVCPKCKGELEYRAEAGELVCAACRLRYEVRDDIPIMLVDEAKPL